MSSESSGTLPFASSLDHLLAEVELVRALLAVAVARASAVVEDGGGLIDPELDDLLLSPLGTPRWVRGPAALPAALLELPAQVRATIERRRAVSEGLALRLDELVARCGLVDADRDLLVLALAPELDVRVGQLYARLARDPGRTRPSVDLALGLLATSFGARAGLQARLEPDAPLIRAGLIERPDEGGAPRRLTDELTLSTRALAFLRGDDAIDPALVGVVRRVSPGAHELLDAGVASAQIPVLERLIAEGRTTLFLHGSDAAGRRLVAEVVARRRGRALLIVDGLELARVALRELAPVLQAILREAAIGRADLLCEGFDALVPEERAAQRRRVLAALHGSPLALTVLAGASAWEPGTDDATPLYRVALERLSAEEQRELWRRRLGPTVEASLPDALARAFRLGAGPIDSVVATARRRAALRDPAAATPGRDDLFEAARLHGRRGLDDLARRVELLQTWDDLILPDDPKTTLRELCDRVRLQHRVLGEWGAAQRLAGGRGQTALLCGAPGTGKTMAAAIVAAELGLPCYAIDLATIVSKYIGETEKNLARLFAAAEETGAVLVFDEADALFGKRTRVQDANDRHANIEVSYLLQRIEHYEGVVMLTSNLRKNIDPAFIRRIHFIIEFPLPGPREREAIWRRALPIAAPQGDDIDFKWLGERFELAGGHISNIAIAAAYRAAAEDAPIAMRHLLHAARREYQNLGGLIAAGFFDGPAAGRG